MMTEKDEKENLLPLSHTFTPIASSNPQVKITHKYTLGNTEKPTFCVRFSPNDKLIATGSFDGTIRIFNVQLGTTAYIMNEKMFDPMPTTQIKWRPSRSMAVTKNVIISVNSNGYL